MSNANEFHEKPEGFQGQPCPICGAPKGIRGSHRSVGPDEQISAGWVHRWKTQRGWRQRLIGKRKSPSRPPCVRPHHVGPMRKTVERLYLAADLIVRGVQVHQAAKRMGMAVEAFQSLKTDHPELWREAEKTALANMDNLKNILANVRAMAGTQAVLDDPDTYLAQAEAAEKWARLFGRRLFEPSGEMGLSEFFEQYYRPTCFSNVSDGTVRLYRTVLKLWRFITGDPPIEAITIETLALFRDAMARRRGTKPHLPMSPITVSAYLQRIQTLLDKAGPAGPRNRDAAGILAKVPWVRPPQQPEIVPEIVDPETLRMAYVGAVAMDVPKIPGIKAPAWWQALLSLAANTGLRRGTLFALRWEWVDLKARKIIVPPNAMKNRRGKVVPLNDDCITHLQRIRGVGRDLVFGFPNCRRHFDTLFHKLQRAAGIPRAKHFGLQHLRRTLATVLWEQAPAVAVLALGHAASAVTMKHYVNSGTMLATAVDGLRQPWAV